MKKYKYNINNLDCANCAREIEESLNKNKDLKNVIVNFNTSKLSYESDKEFTLKEMNDLVKKVEPDAYLSKEEIETKNYFSFKALIIGLVIGLLGYFLKLPNIVKIILYLISYSFLLYKTFINAIKLLIKNKIINENFLITISCFGALAIGEVLEGMMVITLYTIGKILEEKAVNNSRKSIKNLLDIKQNYANKKVNNELKTVKVEDVKIGDILVIKKGEKIPLDGEIIKGETSLDTSALTGESEEIVAKVSSKVLSGSINKKNVIEIKVTTLYEDSTVAKILELLENATDKKTKMETTVSKISKIYTPVIILLALLLIVMLPIFTDASLKSSIYKGLTFLVISCPCAIAISVPLSYFTGIGIASKKGILIKGSTYLDNLSNAKNIIFDKTGTLTNGSFRVENISISDDSYSKDDVIEILRKGESFSNHPIAKTILSLSDKKIDNKDVKDYKEIEGKGISFTLDNKKILIGNKNLCNCDKDTVIHLNIDKKHVASITINDGIKENAKETIANLKKKGLKTYMFTGDKKDIALAIGKRLGIDEIKYEMLPTDKFTSYEEVSKDNLITIFVGDGINDTPVLKRADIGIAMGMIGQDAAIEASDVVLMKDDLTKIILAISISRYTKHIMMENLVFAIFIKILILLLSVFSLANMWFAVFADTGVTLLTVINTLRIVKKYN
ncbi:cadmium-translocating P-type ATPase [bacterium]|nr:cadmium-translocating P-type ATPase [bacterium]